MKYIDTHAHYNDEHYDKILEDVLSKCKDAGVEKIINVGYNKQSSIDSIDLSNNYDYIYAVIGVHPQDIDKNNASDIYEVYKKHNNNKIVAIGEIGLDYSYTKENREEQIKNFIEQIELANTLKLPVVIHSRDAALDTYNVIKENKPEYGLLFHCFCPTDDLVKLVLERGYSVAFGGNITFKRNESFGKYIQMIPVEKIVIETDSPYLSPVPYRGKLNTSANLGIICDKLAEYKNLDTEYVADIVYNNSEKFCSI